MGTALDPALLGWLLDTDPALRWQVERDLAGARPRVWEATPARVATEGHGAKLLVLQDRDGQWAAGACFLADAGVDPHAPPPPEEEDQPWTATTRTLDALRDLGLDATALAGRAELLAASCRWSTATSRTGAAHG